MRRLQGFAIVMVLVLGGLPKPASAQFSVDDRCRNATAGLVLGMQTQIAIGNSRQVALESSGLAPGGPGYRVADQAYRQLAAGAPVERLLDAARAQCREIGPEAFEDEEPTFETSREADGRGGGAQLCGDLANSMAGLLVDDPATRTMSLDDALQAFRSSDPRDIPTPQLRRALQLAQQRARVSPDAQELQQLLFRHCEGLSTPEREALDREFYVP